MSTQAVGVEEAGTLLVVGEVEDVGVAQLLTYSVMGLRQRKVELVAWPVSRRRPGLSNDPDLVPHVEVGFATTAVRLLGLSGLCFSNIRPGEVHEVVDLLGDALRLFAVELFLGGEAAEIGSAILPVPLLGHGIPGPDFVWLEPRTVMDCSVLGEVERR